MQTRRSRIPVLRLRPAGLRGSRGVVTVEMAVVSPLIFLLFVGSLELTSVNFARQTAGNAAYESARRLIVSGATEADARAEGIRLMNLAGVGAQAAVTFSQTETTATATVSVPASSVSWGLLRFTGGLTLRQSCTLTKE